MTETAFIPNNDIEQQLLDTQEGRMSGDDFINNLLDAQVFMPVKDESVAGIQLSDKAKPLTMEADDGTPILVVFTSPDRAKDFLAAFDGESGGLLETFRWIIEHAGTGVGVSLNPGWDFGFDLEPEMVAELIQS